MCSHDVIALLYVSRDPEYLDVVMRRRYGVEEQRGLKEAKRSVCYMKTRVNSSVARRTLAITIIFGSTTMLSISFLRYMTQK